jgi:hypothetical protein
MAVRVFGAELGESPVFCHSNLFQLKKSSRLHFFLDDELRSAI